jgi:hypothetical protein
MELSCHDHQAGMGCMKHDIWCEGCMYVGMAYMSLSVKKARKVSGSRDGRRSASRKRALVFQAFIQEEELLGGSQPSGRLSRCLCEVQTKETHFVIHFNTCLFLIFSPPKYLPSINVA